MDIKRAVKLGVSLMWFGARACAALGRRAFGGRRRASAVLLYYHGIRPDERVRFARQMDVLLRWATPIAADAAATPDEPRHFAGVTFDDGLCSFAESALPELARRRIPSTLFVIADRMGRFPDWPAFVPDPTFSEPMLTIEQLRRLPRDLVTIGSHTMSHPTLTHIGDADARQELEQSRARLERVLDRRVTLFSFPHGAHDERLIGYCREFGYERVFTILPYPAFASPREYVVGRVSVEPTDWPIEFWLKLMGAYSWLPMAFRLKQRLLTPRGGQPAGALSRSAT